MKKILIGFAAVAFGLAANVGLGLRRANVVRMRLIEAGVDASAINVTSHGEATLLVPTADDVSEPKNRRVEISVR